MYSSSTTQENKILKYEVCFTCQLKYSSFIEELQRDSDEDGDSEKIANVELPFQV